MTTTSAANPSSLLESVACPICGNAGDFEPTLGSRADHHIRKLGIPGARSRWAICRRCGLVMQNPRPSSELYRKLYEESVYHEHHYTPEQIEKSVSLAEYCFDEKVRFLDERLKERGLPLDVLDIGCGMGSALSVFKRRGYRAEGIQPDPLMTAIARDHFGIDTRQGFFSKEAYPAETFSSVFTNHVFEHFDDPFSVVEGIARILRPNGLCFTCVPTYAMNKTWIALDWMNVSHNWLFTRETLSALFARVGLKYVAHTYSGTPKYTDELWLVVEKPAGALPASPESVVQCLPDWRSVKRTLDFTVHARSVAHMPLIVSRKIRKFVELTDGLKPAKVADYLRQVASSRGTQLKLWAGSFTRPKG